MTGKLMRYAHLYAGLFISPFIVLFALTAVFFNHALSPSAASDTRYTKGVRLQFDPAMDNLPLAREILQQLGIRGEIMFVGRNPGSMYIPVVRPDEKIIVNVDFATREANVQRERQGLYEALLYMHKSPGPHVAAIRGNWWLTRLWGSLADCTVLLTLFLTVSGVYLWFMSGLQRRSGLILSAAGCILFMSFIALLV